MSIFFIAVASYIAFCDEWELTIEWAKKNIDWIKQFVDLPFGIPSEATFYRVFRAINPKEFERRFIGWTKQLASWHNSRTIAIDGKTLCGAKENPGDKSPFHIVSAWASDNNFTLGFLRTNAKSNEITAIPELLKLLSIEGDIVTIDAMGAQTEIARQIVEGNKADYVLSLKRNQPSMYYDTALFFTDVDLKVTGSTKKTAETDDTISVPDDSLKAAVEQIYKHFANAKELSINGNGRLPVFAEYNYQFLKTRDLGHGRIENRLYFLVSDVSWLSRHDEWVGLKSVGMVISSVEIKKTGEKSTDCRFYINSIDNINDFAKSVRNHWGCESTHYVLDVTFSEDKSRTRKENGALNDAVFRRIALNMLKVERDQFLKGNPKKKISYKVLRFKAGLETSFLEKIMVNNLA
jgi:predicted transposase YbfD/YdcC